MKVHDVELIESGDMVCRDFRTRGDFEPHSVHAWCQHISGSPPDHLVLDIGAYSGLYAILAARCGATNVQAWEPNREMFRRMVENIGRNLVSGITPVLAAAGPESGPGRLHKRFPTSSAARVSLGVGPGDHVDVRRLDVSGPISAIKLDTEGGELAILESIEPALVEHHPLVIAETLDQVSYSSMAAYLGSLGYDCRAADSRNLVATPCESSPS